ncbi:hypothetical protein MMAD_46590 [Mycolicibacterium madagascariense]|uniref:Uncharacterized protein n=1 Tax=Mycolicibacterium madagascariense TaxID=212765 RepID=A0A7I7XMB3_9MYCO|nr:hypothetical protein [Mycolicibacterium madagascariense]MCV7013060.1 hypothetical protein [Mycolicibacterium madagascariense]BBZ30364.1 hypothetical protein MMAD_46590 [Mycolicibacterium madagascariense]
MGKWDDDFPLQPRGSVQPSSVAGLLRTLELTDASERDRSVRIQTWLKDHEPSPGMEYSLRRNGYGSLLDGRATA